MTYDTTTADGLLVRSGSRNDSSEAAGSGLTISQVSVAQKSDNGLRPPITASQQSTDSISGKVDENDSMILPPTPNLSQPSGSSPTERSDEAEVSENNNTLSLPTQRNDVTECSPKSSQTLPVFNDINHLAGKTNMTCAGEEEEVAICYNPVLDNEIRNRLDQLNALSDLINSLELRFDQANMLFRETLKCSTERLSNIAKTLGSKSIRHGRIYQEAKLSVEKTQTDCKRACVQFEKANNDHQFAKEAIREAETRLKEMNVDTKTSPKVMKTQHSSFEFNDLGKLSLEDDGDEDDSSKQECSEFPKITCDNPPEGDACDSTGTASTSGAVAHFGDGSGSISSHTTERNSTKQNAQNEENATHQDMSSYDETKILNAAQLSEELNHAINRLFDAEQKRRQSERLHLDQANKLMVAQENLLKLEREYGASIKRSQIYFDEARRFNVRLNSVKDDIALISEEIIAAKQAYAKTLHELEKFSENLHLNSNHISSSDDQYGSSRQSIDDSEHLNSAR